MAVTQASPRLGLTLPGTTNPDVTNSASSIAALVAAFIALEAMTHTLFADTGAANAYAVALPAGVTPSAGTTFRFKAAHANTGASTIAINGGTATAITKDGTTALAGAEIAANAVCQVTFDGTQWQLALI